ncbi:exodeoxyribonuclease VIII [Yokenella regensburgei]|uniref:Exodeoxyribonuclease VIII n=1 Tax=Yokenella regensburgei TaxID=158877 RepID=A0ABX9S3D7_9ENTR|nr:exonuclease [Yokenella regensburgei]RKR64996.1 exodeoxyribonuclease VIII [Yokenella regensburgei]VFS14531.1 Exodeoxyribonuclease 8 [Yokenella regensburgei]
MNNYAYLIKAKAKSTDAKSQFCQFPAKSDSRAEREILNILEDAGIQVGRGADHQLPIRTNFPVFDDLPEDGVLDATWCDRYELGGVDGLTWQKIVVAEAAPAPASTVLDTTAQPADDSAPLPATIEQPLPSANEDEDLVIDPDDDDRTEYPVAQMTFSRRLLSQFICDSTAHHINQAQRVQVIELSIDTDNHYVQNLLLTTRNIPELENLTTALLWKYTNAVKTVFDPALRHELTRVIQFSKLWLATEHPDRGILVREWAKGNRITSVMRTPSGADAGGYNNTDRLTPQTKIGLEYEISLGLLAREHEFDIYNVPFEIDAQASAMMNRVDNHEFLATCSLFTSMPGGLDYSRACNIATVKTTPEGLWKDPPRHREHLNRVMTETDHAHPDQLIVDIACGCSSSPMPMTSKEPQPSEEEINKQLAAERGEPVPGISDSNDPNWIHEDLTKMPPAHGETEESGNVSADVEDDKPRKKTYDDLRNDLHEAIASIKPKNPPIPETTSDVQMEETGNIEDKATAPIPESPATDLPVESDASAVEQATVLNTGTSHHNNDAEECQDFPHLMVDVESLGNNPDAPIVSIGAVFFNPSVGAYGPEFYKVISLESAMASGGITDASTIIWWLKQSSEARSAIVVDDAIPLDDALLQLNDFISENTTSGDLSVQVWGNGATFDNVLMRRSYKRSGITCPWKIVNDRDVRTIVELGNAVGIDPRYSIPFEGDMHNALADARHQAKYVSAIWQRLTAN